ncbi:ATPase [Clostridium niameyense]|uniref:ATPase n=1 Tax=Clostridium niameyense TaxID=1622073 RepID=A0A6M0R6U9_9CLOT|nr:ATPase [Clostridium niameyense]NEZ45921.1 ATPase [Clostridium niameyense]
MAIEAIESIRIAENRASTILKQAKDKSKDIVKNSNEEARKKYEKIIKDAEKEAKDIIEKSIETAKKDSIPILDKGIESVKNIRNVSQDNLNKAINIVIERIVKVNGNS